MTTLTEKENESKAIYCPKNKITECLFWVHVDKNFRAYV